VGAPAAILGRSARAGLVGQALCVAEAIVLPVRATANCRPPRAARVPAFGREKVSAGSGAPPSHTVAEFFTTQGAKFEKRILTARRKQRGLGQLCDRNVRDDFTQPSNSPDHGIKPVRRAVDGAIPLAGKRHHLALELIEPAAMQHTLLFV